MAIVKPFEEHGRRYEQWFETHRFAYQSEVEAVRALLPAEGHGIEIGVGSGRFAEPLGISVGIDPSPSMREVAERRGVHTVDGVAEDLP